MPTTYMFNANKLLICLLLLCIYTTTTHAQSKSSVSGTVVDSLSKAPIEFATVAIINAKDTSLISYTLTQNNGSFKLSGLPVSVQTKLIVSAMGYGTFRQPIVFKPGENKETGSVFLNAKSLKEVVIKGERSPVTIRKDTIEFSA
ncbi:MAG TPA: carboxypeptidase-like regulatory domain-containing protein, partial [Mucilaginibacter sp.]|nr:carboxypeptidase-like regulatory domain-containing protein [Mucilaginibacter sp.]